MKRSARITIHPQALQHNLNRARQEAPDSKTTAVIKANAYGHGAVEAAGILYDKTEGFAVSCIAEAVELRQAHIDRPITVLQGFQSTDDLRIAEAYQLRLTVHHKRQLSLLDQFSPANSQHRFDLNIKMDSGMHRLGFAPDEFINAVQKLQNHTLVNPDGLVLMTHLSSADEKDKDTTRQQISLFNKNCDALNKDHPKSIANSAGILGWKESHSEWIRPGIMLYGSSPFSETHRDTLDLKAAMTLNAPIITIRHLKKGEAVGYGGTWVCERDTITAIIACGYADGYPRHARSGTPVLIHGEQAKLIGRVSMDMIIIDITDIKEARVQVGDLAELWGKNLSIDTIAQCAETISYELLCNAGNLCERMGT